MTEMEVFAQNFEFSDFFRKKANVGTVKRVYGTRKIKMNKKCQYF